MTTPPVAEDTPPLTVNSRLSGYVSRGGFVLPLVTALVAFAVGGLVVALQGSNPLTTYGQIFEGAGLNWLLPWVTGDARELAGTNLQETLLKTAPLILTGLAVALAFRLGLFNIGGQGQYIVGSIVSVWVASELHSLPGVWHIVLALILGGVAGAAWAGIAGVLRATTGANEVISTIMLNWIALWIAMYVFGLDGPLHSSTAASLPVSNPIDPVTHLPVFWGDPQLHGLHIGILIAVAACGAFWLLLNRTTTGYEIRAVGLNPDAAEYAGINVGRRYIKTMAICGLFAGLAGAIDVLGWEFQLATNDIQTTSNIAFLGIAVALLGRNTATGVLASAFLFGVLVNGTSVRNLDPQIFSPSLASNLTVIIQALIVLFVSAPMLVTSVWGVKRWLKQKAKPAVPREPASEGAKS